MAPPRSSDNAGHYSPFNNNILSEQTLRNESISQKIIINSRVYNSNITYSYIQSSKMYGNIIKNSIVLDSVFFNTTAYNCTLKNTTLYNSEAFNGTYNDDYYSALDGNRSSLNEEMMHGGVNLTFLVFGIFGIIILFVVVVGGSFLIAGFVIKRRKERLLVRSAVMGDIRSW